MKLRSSAEILAHTLFIYYPKSREDRTKAQQARDSLGASWIFGSFDHKATTRLNNVEGASAGSNAYEVLLSGIKGKRKIETKMVEQLFNTKNWRSESW